jgi:hypothetical protein
LATHGNPICFLWHCFALGTLGTKADGTILAASNMGAASTLLLTARKPRQDILYGEKET